MLKNDIRGLTSNEITAVPGAISRKLNLNRVEIHNRKWTFLTPSNVTVARGYKIYWPGAPDEASSLSHLSHLVHEIVHVWQYNVMNVGLYSPRWMDRRYTYELNPGDIFLNFGLEQQASIVEDAFILSSGGVPRRARNRPSLYLYEKVLGQISKST